MVVYNCPRCGYSTSNKSYYRKHLLRRNPCKVVLQDINVKDILSDIETHKVRDYKKKQHSKKTCLKTENVTKKSSKQLNPEIHEELCQEHDSGNTVSGVKLLSKNVTKSQISVSRKNLTLKPGKTRCISNLKKNTPPAIMLKNDAYTPQKTHSKVSRGVSMHEVTKKPHKSSIDNDLVNTTNALMMHTQDAYTDMKKNSTVRRGVSMHEVTKKPHESSIDDELVNTTTALMMHTQDAYTAKYEIPRVSRNVSMQKVTLKPPESSMYCNQSDSIDGTIMHKKEAYAKNSYKRCVSQNVNIPVVTFNSPDSSLKETANNNEDAGNIDKYKTDTDIGHNYKAIHKKIITNKPQRSIRNYYCNINNGENLQDSKFNPVLDNNYDSDKFESESVEYDQEPIKSSMYYNNFDAPPVMKPPHRNHYSPNKLHTTNIKDRDSVRYCRQSSNYADDSFDDEYIEDHGCSYCGKYFSHRQSKWRHEKKCNSKNVLADKCSRLEKQNKEKDDAIQQLKRQMEIMMEKVGNEVHNHNHNTTNYTFNVVLNAFGNESTDYLSSSKVKQILDQGGAIDCIPRLLKAIHFSPEHVENRNVMIPNRKDNIAKIWDGSQWVLKSKNLTLNEMTDKAYNMLNEHYEEGNKQLDQFNDKYANGDKPTKRRVIQDTELMIINNGKDNTKTIAN